MLFSVSPGLVDRRLGHDHNTIHEITLRITNSLFDGSATQLRKLHLREPPDEVVAHFRRHY